VGADMARGKGGAVEVLSQDLILAAAELEGACAEVLSELGR
jgi:hypothetical protein